MSRRPRFHASDICAKLSLQTSATIPSILNEGGAATEAQESAAETQGETTLAHSFVYDDPRGSLSYRGLAEKSFGSVELDGRRFALIRAPTAFGLRFQIVLDY
jgi:hypothetical protein